MSSRNLQEIFIEAYVLREKTRVTVETARRIRDNELVLQCAWCQLFGDGNGSWWLLENNWFLRPSQITSSICNVCLKEQIERNPKISEKQHDYH